MANPSSQAPTPPASGPANPDPAATLRATVYSVSVDAAELARQLPGDDTSARMLDRLSEELAEAAAMFRSLPGRPAGAPGHDWQILAGLRTAHAVGEDIGATVVRALAQLAAELGGARQVLRNRPGSWEAMSVRELLRCILGPDDENLPAYGPGPGSGSSL